MGEGPLRSLRHCSPVPNSSPASTEQSVRSLWSQSDKLLSSTNRTYVTFDLATGAFRGSAPNPDNPAAAPIPFSGVVLQRQNFGSGWFLGTNQSGSVYLGPADAP